MQMIVGTGFDVRLFDGSGRHQTDLLTEIVNILTFYFETEAVSCDEQKTAAEAALKGTVNDSI
jgi:hypothetical protein